MTDSPIGVFDSGVGGLTVQRDPLARQEGEGTTRFLATDSPERFVRIGSRFLERPIDPEEVERVDL